MAAKPIPEGYHSATPYLIVKGAAEAIEFYKRAFGAAELSRMAHPTHGHTRRSRSATPSSCLRTRIRTRDTSDRARLAVRL